MRRKILKFSNKFFQLQFNEFKINIRDSFTFKHLKKILPNSKLETEDLHVRNS